MEVVLMSTVKQFLFRKLRKSQQTVANVMIDQRKVSDNLYIRFLYLLLLLAEEKPEGSCQIPKQASPIYIERMSHSPLLKS